MFINTGDIALTIRKTAQSKEATNTPYIYFHTQTL